MTDFKYTARQANGKIVKGTINAHDRGGAMSALRTKQLQPVIIQEEKTKKSLKMNINVPGLKAVKNKDLVIFSREFATMFSAGVPILKALTILKDQTASAKLKEVLEIVIEDVGAGVGLSEALAKHPKVFSDIYVNMVKAGEQGGILDQVLKNIASQQEKDAAIKGKIKAAMIYPLVVFSVTLVAFFVLMTFIVPKIGKIITSLSNGTAKLPIYTRVLLSVSSLMKQPWFILTLFIVLPVLFILFRQYIKTEKGRYRWHSLLLRIPVVNVIITKAAVARFSRIFAYLISAGVNIVLAIDTTAKAMGNAVIEKELLGCSAAIKAGSSFSAEIAKCKHFPPIVSQMLEVGEETGKTDEVIIKIAEFYEEEVDNAVGAMSSIIEPVMIVVLGLMVGIVAISVFAPIVQLSGHVSTK